MDPWYSSVEAVIRQSGAHPEDLEFTSNDTDDDCPTVDALLEAQIEEWLIQAKDFIDKSRNRDYLKENDVPPGIHQIACQIVCNMVSYSREIRKGPFIKVGEVTVRIMDPKVITTAIKEELDLYPRKVNGIKPLFRIMRLRGQAEIDEENNPDITVE